MIIIKTMFSFLKSPSIRQVWTALALRSLLLMGALFVSGFFGLINSELAFLCIGWLLLSLLTSLAMANGWHAASHFRLSGLADLVFGLTLIAHSGGVHSPLWWTLIIGPLGFAAVDSIALAPLWMFVAIACAYILPYVLPGLEPYPLRTLLTYALILLPASTLLAWFENRLIEGVSFPVEETRPLAERVRRTERSRANELVRMAVEINSSLNVEEVLDLALDLSTRAVISGDAIEHTLRSALLLLTDDGFEVVASRHLRPEKQQIVLVTDTGALSRALVRGDSLLARHPDQDPDLKQLSGLWECCEVFVAPLTYQLEIYGVLLYGHPTLHFFNEERRDLLNSIAQQVSVALHNARLYESLETEKKRISELEEEAQKKLARNLHDGPIQTIAAITMRVNFARRLIERNPEEASEELMRVEDMARQTTREIRHMLFTIRPLILERSGLIAALNQLADKENEIHHQNILIETDSDLPRELDLGKQGALFYIAEELVNNARKHAEAAHIWVRLRREEDRFIIEVEDDGVGFNVGGVDAYYEQRGSLGFVNMRERADLVDGILHIESAEGEGTRITLSVSLEASQITQNIVERSQP
ncbi:MAG: GAF domain-containing sensor histidine kinase [Anaerolineales bacterium]|nr:GAF domain-containing sensor histidine kinase [Anaerolineales bacterium]